MTETRTLLREYVEEGSESAFRELVERYIDLVYSTALRLVDGDSHRAEDVAQMVFVRLTRKAGTLGKEASLGGWLHRDTCHVAATLMRGERRRQIRERQAVEMNALHDDPDANFTRVLPILDEAINELGDEDREAIMLRFFEQQSFRALGEIVGSSEDAARMRVNRALEKLQGLLRNQGVAALTVGGLATVLGTKAVSAAPVGLAATVLKGIGSGAMASGGAMHAAVRAAAKGWKLALAGGAAFVLIVSVGMYVEHRAVEKAGSSRAQSITAVSPKPVAAVPVTPPAEAPVATESTNIPSGFMRFQVVDAGSGAPLAATKVRFVYFPSRNANVLNVQTDAKGVAMFKLPQAPDTSANIFVTAAGHAPMVTSLEAGEEWPANYVMKMPAGGFVGGMVVDEEQQPVTNVKIEFEGPGIDMTKRENVGFGPDATRYTDETGRWWSDTVPVDLDNITVMLSHPDFAATVTNFPGDNLDSARAVLVIRKGVLIKGTVVDPSGQPIAGASVKQAENRMWPALSAKSDETGRFELGRSNQRELTLAVQAKGFSPVVLEATLSNNPAELNFKLAPGHILRGRVVDESSAPVTNATIQTETDNYGVRKVNWSGKTDKEGRFEWKSAPGEALRYSFAADGFSGISQSLRADEAEHEIKLRHGKALRPALNVRLRGTVVDADTGQPLDQFKVLVGRVLGPPEIPPEFQFGTDGKDGRFDFRKDMIFAAPYYEIEIQKDGYAPVASTNLSVTGGDQILMFDLHKSAGLKGEVLLPNGERATNASVFLYERQGGVYMDKPGEFQKGPATTALRVQADDHGHFSFAAVLDPRGFIAIHDQGYADVPMGEFKGTITLQPWGRVEGKLLVGGHPGVGQKVTLGQVLYRSYGYGRLFAPLQLYLETTTDGDGNFVFEKVPPGERSVSQRLEKPGNGPGRVFDAKEKPITVVPGTVTRVELGGGGTMVRGRASFGGATDPINWREVAAELTLKISDGTGKAPKREDYPSLDVFLKASQAYSEAQHTFWSSEKGHELDKSRRSYSAYCAEDGSFSIPDVPPGPYNLKIDIRQRTTVGQSGFDGKEVGVLEREVDVPESTDGNEHAALDLGILEVPAAKDGNGQ